MSEISDTKTCIKCGFTGDDELFRPGKNTCKKCEGEYSQDYIKEHRETQKTIYISNNNQPTYEEIEKQAKQDEKGVGSFLCKVFREWRDK